MAAVHFRGWKALRGNPIAAHLAVVENLNVARATLTLSSLDGGSRETAITFQLIVLRPKPPLTPSLPTRRTAPAGVDPDRGVAPVGARTSQAVCISPRTEAGHQQLATICPDYREPTT